MWTGYRVLAKISPIITLIDLDQQGQRFTTGAEYAIKRYVTLVIKSSLGFKLYGLWPITMLIGSQLLSLDSGVHVIVLPYQRYYSLCLTASPSATVHLFI
jgi:hypothetical protein